VTPQSLTVYVHTAAQKPPHRKVNLCTREEPLTLFSVFSSPSCCFGSYIIPCGKLPHLLGAAHRSDQASRFASYRFYYQHEDARRRAFKASNRRNGGQKESSIATFGEFLSFSEASQPKEALFKHPCGSSCAATNGGVLRGLICRHPFSPFFPQCLCLLKFSSGKRPRNHRDAQQTARIYNEHIVI
jgi:hypothetical protein